MGHKHLQVAVWAVCFASAAGTFAAPQKVTVYTSTNPTNYNPTQAEVVLRTELLPKDAEGGELDLVWKANCVSEPPPGEEPNPDCTAAKGVWNEIQDAAEELDDLQLGKNGVLHVIMMKKDDPHGLLGGYNGVYRAIALYPDHNPSRRPRVAAHETGHDKFRKHVGVAPACKPRCRAPQLKSMGTDEGFAKMVAHRVTGESPPAPSRENVEDILRTSTCRMATLPDQQRSVYKCAHDIGNLVFEAYKKLADANSPHFDAFEVYRDALRDLDENDVTPATLHDKVSEEIERILDQKGVVPRNGVNNYAEGRGASFWLDYWTRWLWRWRIIDSLAPDEAPH